MAAVILELVARLQHIRISAQYEVLAAVYRNERCSKPPIWHCHVKVRGDGIEENSADARTVERRPSLYKYSCPGNLVPNLKAFGTEFSVISGGE